MNGEETHNHYLDRLVNHLELVDENMHDFRFIFKEGIYLQDFNKDKRKMCDVFAGYVDGSVFLAELKATFTKKDKAVSQLYSGKELAENLGLKVKMMKLVVYDPYGIKDYMVIR